MYRYLDWSYWFSRLALPFTDKVALAIEIILVAMIVFGLASKIVSWKTSSAPWRKFYNKIGNLLITLGLLFGLNFLLTQSHIPVLGSRFWFGLWMVVGVIWLVFLLRYIVWQMPKDIKQKQNKELLEKYLPK